MIFGENWQRKVWWDGRYYWRGYYDENEDEIQFEYIDSVGLVGNLWIRNVNADIDCSGFDAGAILSDFTVRGGDGVKPTSIAYSDGIDVWVAESNEVGVLNWGWQNTNKVFDGTSPDWYKRVALSADRKTPEAKLWVSAVFYDDSDGEYYIRSRQQNDATDVTSWKAAIDISSNTNINVIYGVASRSMAEAGAAKDDHIWLYKEGDAVRSQHWNGGALKGIQTLDATASSGKAEFDLEHTLLSGMEHVHAIWIDSDGDVLFSTRDTGIVDPWGAPEVLDTGAGTDVSLAEHGYHVDAIWKSSDSETHIHHRTHNCVAETWDPILADPPEEFDVSTEAVITTNTVFQIRNPDGIEATDALLLTWIGQAKSCCDKGWGVLELLAPTTTSTTTTLTTTITSTTSTSTTSITTLTSTTSTSTSTSTTTSTSSTSTSSTSTTSTNTTSTSTSTSITSITTTPPGGYYQPQEIGIPETHKLPIINIIGTQAKKLIVIPVTTGTPYTSPPKPITVIVGEEVKIQLTILQEIISQKTLTEEERKLETLMKKLENAPLDELEEKVKILSHDIKIRYG